MMWEPISFEDISTEIAKAESTMHSNLLSFWQLIKINPEKWQEESYGQEGGGFWAVAIFDARVIWYNDIEDGFNISPYKIPGTIAKHYCEQYTLTEILYQILNSK